MLPLLPGRKDGGRKSSGVYFGEDVPASPQAMRDSKDSEGHDEVEAKSGSANSHRSNSHDVNEAFSRSTTSTGVSLHQKSDDLVVSHLPVMPDAELQQRAFWKAVEGLGVVIGGWALLIFALYLFKALAVKVSRPNGLFSCKT